MEQHNTLGAGDEGRVLAPPFKLLDALLRLVLMLTLEHAALLAFLLAMTICTKPLCLQQLHSILMP